MNRKNNKLLALLVCVSLFLANCGIPNMINGSNSLQSIHQDIQVHATPLSYEATKALFNKRGHKLRKRGSRKSNIFPLVVSVENNSRNTWLLGPDQISLEQINYDGIYDKTKCHPITRGFVGGTLIFATICPLSYVGLVSAVLLCCTCATGPFAPIAAGIAVVNLTTLVGGSVATSYWVKKAEKINKLVNEELTQTMLFQEATVIEPGQSFSKLIFVEKKNLKNQFAITLDCASDPSQKLSFSIDLEQNKA